MSKAWCILPAAFAKHRNRLSTFACTTSIGPGALNMVTGAGVATVDRGSCSGVASAKRLFCESRPALFLQQIEHPMERDVSASDAFRPVSRFFDRISRPEQLLASLPEAFRILTDPAETGADYHQFARGRPGGKRLIGPLRFREARMACASPFPSPN